MKYCPKCEQEFQDSATMCVECDYALIGEQQWCEMQAERKVEAEEVFVRAGIAGDRFEADVMKDALEKENIPVLVRSFQDTSFDGIFVPQKGWGMILVPREFLSRATEIIASLE